MAKMFHHRLEGSMVALVSRDPQEIVDTLLYYTNERKQRVPIPNISDIKPVERVNILVAFPMLHKDHFVEADILPEVRMEINANAFEYTRRVSSDYEKLKRGKLYKFPAGLFDATWLLSKEVMEAMRNYDWSKHTSQVDQWLGSLDTCLRKAESTGLVKRFIDPLNPPLPSN